MTTSDPSLRCSPVARALGFRPIGTAAHAPVFVLVETPLPWPRDVADHPLLQPLGPVLSQHRARLQAVLPDGTTPADSIRVVVYAQPEASSGVLSRYKRFERLVPADDLVGGVSALLADGIVLAPSGASSLVDVLVCTHGARDVCCGRDGVPVFAELAAKALPGVRVWRTTHTGGHRFAPTAVTLPDGRAWAWIEASLLADIVNRTANVEQAVTHDRGFAAVDDPFGQAAESAVLATEGWSWLDRRRTVEVDPLDENSRIVTVAGLADPDDAHPAVVYRAEVELRRVVPVPDCGLPLEQATKSSPEVEVVNLERQRSGSA